MKIRKAVSADYDQISTLLQKLHPAGSEAGKIGEENAWQEVLSHPGTAVFCAEAEEQIIATVTLHVLPNLTYAAKPYGVIENVIVLEDFRGHEIGRQIMNHAIEYAFSKKCYKIMLLTGSARGAEKFYKNLGFSSEEKVGMVLRR